MADITTSGNPDLPSSVMANSRDTVNGSKTSLRWPAEHGRYYTIIKFVQYNRTNPKNPALELPQADIVLPLPSNLREYYAIQYGDVEFDKLGGALATGDDLVNDYIKKGGINDKLLDRAGAASVEFSQALARRTANFFSNDLGGVIDITQGNIVNPHITSVFRGVGLREHTLSWKLHAKSPDESTAIRNIIAYVRNHMHPIKKSQFLLDFPDEVYVRFFADNKQFLFPIFKAVVTGMIADRSSEGANAFFAGSDEAVVINFEMTLKEVEAVTRDDLSRINLGES